MFRISQDLLETIGNELLLIGLVREGAERQVAQRYAAEPRCRQLLLEVVGRCPPRDPRPLGAHRSFIIPVSPLPLPLSLSVSVSPSLSVWLWLWLCLSDFPTLLCDRTQVALRDPESISRSAYHRETVATVHSPSGRRLPRLEDREKTERERG